VKVLRLKNLWRAKDFVAKQWLLHVSHAREELQFKNIVQLVKTVKDVIQCNFLNVKDLPSKPLTLVYLEPMSHNAKQLENLPLFNAIHQQECAGVLMKMVLRLNLPEHHQVLHSQFVFVKSKKFVANQWLLSALHVKLEFQLE
jgi:hypothetical protein